MANNRETITKDIVFNIKTKVADAEKSASEIKNALSKINVSDDLKESLSSALVDLTANIDKLKGKLSSTMSPAEIQKWNKQWNGVSDTLNDIVHTISGGKLSPKDVIFDETTQKRIDKIKISLKQIAENKSKITKNVGARTDALVSGLTKENQLKTAKDLGLTVQAQKDIYSATFKNLDNEQAINDLLSVRAPKYKEILATQQKINSLTKASAEASALKDEVLSSKGRLTNDTKQKVLASSAVDTTGLDITSNKAAFLAAFDKTSITDYSTAIKEANAALVELQTNQQQQAYVSWSSDLVNSAKQVASSLELDEKQSEQLKQELINLATQGAQKAEAGLADFKTIILQLLPSLKQVGDTAEEGSLQLKQLGEQEKFFSGLQGKITQIFGLANAFSLLRTFIRESIQTISGLDAAFTQIAVVTDKTTSQLWESFDTYNDMAQMLGTTTSDAIETSALYYQQGLDTAQVMELTTETIKMARIANMDYSAATEAMTSAIRGFKLEMTDAEHVVDVYSALAAKSAVDTEQLAIAISKTASIAKSAGMEFETTSAFLSQIIETTQEAPETAGTALKTIIARFSEMKENMTSFYDESGELVNVNKVEGALGEVGIMLRDQVTGQIRDIDDVFLELSSRWDGLSRNTQRYIATTAAGSRQQSRFIAMMDDYRRTMELVGIANDAAGASTTQFNKTLDSVEAKANQIKANFESIIGNLINNEFVRGLLDAVNNVMSVLAKLAKMGPGIFIPVIISIFNTIRNIVKTSSVLLETTLKNVGTKINSEVGNTLNTTQGTIQTWIAKVRSMLQTAGWKTNIDVTANGKNINGATGFNADGTPIDKDAAGKKLIARANNVALAFTTATSIVTTALAMSGKTVAATGATIGQSLGGAIGSIWGPVGAAIGNVAGALVGGIFATVSESIKYGAENTQAELDKATKIASKLAQEESEFSGENSTLTELADTYTSLNKKLSQGLNLTAEETLELINAQDQLGRSYSDIVTGRDAETGALTISTNALNALIRARESEAEILSAEAAAAQYKADQINRNNEDTEAVSDVNDSYGTVSNKTFSASLEGSGSVEDQLKEGLSWVNDAITEELSNPDADTVKVVEDYLTQLEDTINQSFPEYRQDPDIINYVNSVRKALGVIQDNLTEAEKQLESIGQFSANITSKFGTQEIDGKVVDNMSASMSADLSRVLGIALGKAVEAGDVDPEAEASATNSISTWLSEQLSGDLAEAYKGIIESGQQEEYDTYSALLPYFAGVKGDIDTILQDTFKVDPSSDMGIALKSANENTVESTLSASAQQAIRDIAAENAEDAAEIAKSLSDFNIETSSLSELESIKQAINDLGYGELATAFIIQLDNKIATLGYTSEEAADRLSTLINTLTEVSGLQTKSKGGTLTAEEVTALIGDYGTKYDFGAGDFSYDATTGGYSGIEIPWDKIRFDAAEAAVGAAQDALATNETAIISEMSNVTGETFSTTEKAINKLVGLMSAEQDGTDVTAGMTDEQKTSYGNAKDYYAAQPILQQTVTTGQQIVDLQGVQSYATAIDAAIAKSNEFIKALKDKNSGVTTLNKSFKLTESEIEAIKKKYPQLAKKMDDVNDSSEDYIDIMNEVNRLNTAETLGETGEAIGGYLDAIKDANEDSEEFKLAMSGIADLLGEGLGAEFAASNLDLIKAACSGNYAAFQELQSLMAQELLVKVGSQVDLQDLMNGLVTVDQLGQEAVDTLVKSGMFTVETVDLTSVIKTWIPNEDRAGGSWSTQKTVSTVQYLKPVDQAGYNGSNFGGSYSGGGGGGGGGGEDYEVKVDKYYNEIAAIEDLSDALEKLADAREHGNLSPEDYRKNLDATANYYKQLQDKLHSYNESLRADQAEIAKKITNLKAPNAINIVNGVLKVNKEALELLSETDKETADGLIEDWDKVGDSISENSDEWWEAKYKLEELADSYRDSFISTEDKIRDVLIQQDQDEIDVLSKKYEKMKEADNDYLEALKDNIDKRRDARDKENDYADLAKKEKRLALLKRDTSGVYGAEILSLEEEITQTRQDLSDKEVDDMVTNLEEQATKRADSYDKELEELNQRQEDKEKSMVEYNKEVDKIMQSGSENILKWLQTYDEEYLTASKTAQQEYLESWKATINEANSYVDNVSNGTVVTTKEKAASDAQGIYTKLSGMTNTATSKKQDSTYATAVAQLQSSNATQALAWFSANMTGRAGIDEPTKKLFWDIVLLKHKYEGLGIPEFPGYSEGGIVNTTGLAMVHGTTTKPEAFLSAADTKNFQILMELLNKAVNYNGQTQSDIPTALQIGECQIIVEVGSISDDYDVEQAVDKVKQAIVDNSNYRNVNIVTRKK